MSADPKQPKPGDAPDVPLKGDNFVSPDRPFPTARGVLSKAEIEALLRPDLPEDLKDKTPDNISPLSQPAFDKSETTELSSIATDIAARLSMVIRQECHLDGRFVVRGQKKIRFAAMSQIADAPVCLFTNAQDRVVAALALAGPVVSAMVNEACGGYGASGRAKAGLSVLETAVAKRLLQPLRLAVAQNEEIALARIETDLDVITSLLPSGEGIEIDLNVNLAGAAGGAVLFVIDDLLPCKASGKSDRNIPEAALSIGHLGLVLTARLASLSVPVSQLSNLKPGSKLLLGVPADHQVEILSGGRHGKCVAEGRLGRKGQNMAVRVSRTRPIT